MSRVSFLPVGFQLLGVTVVILRSELDLEKLIVYLTTIRQSKRHLSVVIIETEIPVFSCLLRVPTHFFSFDAIAFPTYNCVKNKQELFTCVLLKKIRTYWIRADLIGLESAFFFFFGSTGRDFIFLFLVNTFPINNKYINYFITHNISFFSFGELN
jgi:hypothetical protein